MKTPTIVPLRGGLLCVSLAALIGSAGCSSPIRDRAEASLRSSLAAAVQRELDEAKGSPGGRTLERDGGAEQLEIREEYLREIERLYNPERYFADDPDAGRANPLAQVDGLLPGDLYGAEARLMGVGLRSAIASAVARNLAVQEASFGPPISQTEIAQAEAAFDSVFFADAEWRDTDTPSAAPAIPGVPGGRALNSEQTLTGAAGLRRALSTGGSVSAQNVVTYTDVRASTFGRAPNPDPSATSSFVFNFDQPLLEGFGPDVALAEIRLTRNAERAQVAELRGIVIDAVTETERAYWDLVRAHRELVIAARLVERGEGVREEIKARRVLDAVQAQVADAVSAVESRRAEVLRAQRAMRRASDRLKQLMNDPRFPVGSETVLVPTDPALDEPIRFSLVDALSTAFENRPDLSRAVLAIDDASIRQSVAENGRLPTFDLRAELALRGFDANLGDAYGDAFDNEFIDDFAIGALFEQALGNRADEAAYRRARLQRMQSVVSYRRVIQQVTLDVKNALDDVVTNYKLIEQARLSRIAAAEALRTLLVEKELTDRGYTVERLDLELGQQEQLAAAERAEVAALIEYQTALAELYRAQGTALERNRIDFVVPDLNQVSEGNLATDYEVPGRPGAE